MDDSSFVEFRCPNCQTEIQASPDMIGEETECPVCGAKIRVPSTTKESVLRHAPGDDDPEAVNAMKSRTIRIELGDI